MIISNEIRRESIRIVSAGAFVVEEEIADTVGEEARSLQVWRGLMNWLSFFMQIFVSVLRGTPSLAQILSYVGFNSATRHAPRATRHLLSLSSPSFKPLPVAEIVLDETSSPAHASIDRIHCKDEHVGGNHLEKLMVVLDLDETLICAYEASSLPAVLHTQTKEAGLKWFELECVSSDKGCEGKPKISYVMVFERPGLQEFLKQIGEFADLVLFTAGLEDYARPLVERIDANKQFIQRLYRPSTVSTSKSNELQGISRSCEGPLLFIKRSL